MVFYESPHKILRTLKDFKTVFGNERKISISRELTKIFQENQNNIEAFGIITDVNNDEPNTGTLNWSNVSRNYFEVKDMNVNGATKSTHRLNFSSNSF